MVDRLDSCTPHRGPSWFRSRQSTCDERHIQDPSRTGSPEGTSPSDQRRLQGRRVCRFHCKIPRDGSVSSSDCVPMNVHFLESPGHDGFSCRTPLEWLDRAWTGTSACCWEDAQEIDLQSTVVPSRRTLRPWCPPSRPGSARCRPCGWRSWECPACHRSCWALVLKEVQAPVSLC